MHFFEIILVGLVPQSVMQQHTQTQLNLCNLSLIKSICIPTQFGLAQHQQSMVLNAKTWQLNLTQPTYTAGALKL